MDSINKSSVTSGICALLVGLLTGVLTVIGQKYLPGSLNSLANSGAVWLVPAFFVAATSKKKVAAILLCMETLIVCVVSYYWAEAILNRHPFQMGYYFFIWLACAVLAGTIFGLGAFSRGQKSSNHPWGTSLLPAVFLSEGLSELIHLPDYMHMLPAVIGRILIGLVLYFILYKGASGRRKPIVSFGVLTALGMAGYELLFRVTS